jgi:hypothetical protein
MGRIRVSDAGKCYASRVTGCVSRVTGCALQGDNKGRRFIPARTGLNVDQIAEFKKEYLSTYLLAFQIQDLISFDKS